MQQFERGDVFKSVNAFYPQFFQVVEATPKTVTVRRIGTRCEGHGTIMTAHSYETIEMPAKGDFTHHPCWSDKVNSKGKRCRISESCPSCPGTPYIRIDGMTWAIPWDGTPATVDHYS